MTATTYKPTFFKKNMWELDKVHGIGIKVRCTDSCVTFCPVFNGILEAMIHSSNVIFETCLELVLQLVPERFCIPSGFCACCSSNKSPDSNVKIIQTHPISTFFFTQSCQFLHNQYKIFNWLTSLNQR